MAGASISRCAESSARCLLAMELFHSSINGQATAYICSSYNCKLPTSDIDTMLRLLNSNEAYYVLRKNTQVR